MNDRELWRRAEEIFLEALDREGETREDYLVQACDGDEALLEVVSSLLEGHGTEGPVDRLLAEPGAAVEALIGGVRSAAQSLEASEDDLGLIGNQVGPYVIEGSLGRGGMGRVYRAARKTPFHQTVAIKVLRSDLGSPGARQRFDMERQILAALDHPNIAGILDGGETDNGLSYLVLEYVEGETLTNYCDSARLGVEGRLRLFRDVCNAVHHAHQNLIIHRDLKPSNILVTGDGQVKLLDFGIAKLVNPGLAGGSAPLTRTHHRILTPEYASPEQVRNIRMTTVSDVYSLGVLLYELLSGHRPYALADSAPHELSEFICEQDPPRPSTRVAHTETVSRGDGTSEELTPETISRARGISPERLRRGLRGDLDNIVMKAMRKEPKQRYGSAERLAADIGRYLASEPVEARPITVSYRLLKFVRRNLAASAAGGLALASMIAALVLVAHESKQTAAAYEEASAGRQQAKEALAKSEAVSGFMVELLTAADPFATESSSAVTIEELLQRGIELAADLDGEPAVQSRLLGILGETLAQRGDTEQARSVLQEAVTTTREVYDEPTEELVQALVALGSVNHTLGHVDTATGQYREALELRLSLYGPQHPEAVDTMIHVASGLTDQGKYSQAKSILQEGIAILRLQAPTHKWLAAALFRLAALYRLEAEYTRALPLLQEALTVQRQLMPEEHPHVSRTKNELARVLNELGQPEEAMRLVEESLAAKRRLLGERHIEIVAGRAHKAMILTALGDFAAADREARETLALAEDLTGTESFWAAGGHHWIGTNLAAWGRRADAEVAFKRALSLRERAQGGNHPAVAQTLEAIAELAGSDGDTGRARRLLTRAHAIYLAEFGPDAALTRSAAARLDTLR